MKMKGEERESAVVFDQLLRAWILYMKGKERESANVFDLLLLNLDWVYLIHFCSGMK